MITQNKKILYQDMTKLEQIMSEFKLNFYSFMNHIIQENIISLYIFRIFIIIESLQIIYFVIHPRLKFIWKGGIVLQFLEILKYLQVIKTIYLYYIYIYTQMQISFNFLLMKQISIQCKHQQSLGILGYGFKLLNFFGILVKTVQALPFYDIFINNIFCLQNKFGSIYCNNEYKIGFILLSIIGILIQLFFSYIFTLLLNEINPLSNIPFASIPTNIPYIKQIQKLFLCVYLALDYKISITYNFEIIIVAFQVVLLLELYSKQLYCNKYTYYLQIICEIFIFWISLCGFVQGLMIYEGENEDITIFYIIFGNILVNALFFNIIKIRKQNFITLFPDEIKNSDDMKQYCLIMIDLIENRHSRYAFIQLQGILKMHVQKCKYNQDICSSQFLINSDIQIEVTKEQAKWYMFLKSIIDIINDDFEAQEYLEKAAYVSKSQLVNKQFSDNKNMKYSENSNTGILLMSANLSTRFYVQNTNYDFTRILGWPKQEIIDQNIKNHIMPKLLQQIHDGLVQNYIDTSVPKAIGIERLITPVNKDGYLIPCILMIKILPNLDEGLQFVGFFKEINEVYCAPYIRNDDNQETIFQYLIYKVDQNLQNQTLIGITQGCYENYGIPISLVNNNSPMSNQFTIDLIFPQIIQPEIIEQMKSQQGAVIQIDTTIIDQIFLISQESSLLQQDVQCLKESIIDNNLQQISNLDNNKSIQIIQDKYKNQFINIWLVEQFVYKDVTINIVKFCEQDKNQQEEDIHLGNNDNNQEKYNNNNNDDSEQGENYQNEEEQVDLNQDESQQNQGSTLNQEDQDEIRQLKDIKSGISEKSMPKIIKILQISSFIICLALLGLTITELIYKNQQHKIIQKSFDMNFQSFQRPSSVADVHFIIRKMWIIDNLFVSSNFSLNVYINLASQVFYQQIYLFYLSIKLKNIINQLNEILFNVLKSKLEIEQNNLKQQQNQQDQVSQFKQYFYYINFNGMYALRQGSEQSALEYFDYYYDQVQKFGKIFLIIMIIGIFFVVASSMIILPMIFSIQKSNACVLGFFSIVPIEEIKAFSQKCEIYLKIYIERKPDEAEQHNMFIQQKSNEEIQNKQVQQNLEMPDQTFLQNKNANNMSILDKSSAQEVNFLQKNKFQIQNEIKNIKPLEKIEENNLQIDEVENPIKKNLISKDHNKYIQKNKKIFIFILEIQQYYIFHFFHQFQLVILLQFILVLKMFFRKIQMRYFPIVNIQEKGHIYQNTIKFFYKNQSQIVIQQKILVIQFYKINTNNILLKMKIISLVHININFHLNMTLIQTNLIKQCSKMYAKLNISVIYKTKLQIKAYKEQFLKFKLVGNKQRLIFLNINKQKRRRIIINVKQKDSINKLLLKLIQLWNILLK
ncbi:PAS domain S-box family protein [Ichthyophthirius multifiliis]|uniref:PAS domain S-box family protein n=1 Tax=Ichthyophthirius multifiliis TaxID=5932 RepID=G0R2Q0_ICHMU|nr:PAS domain S-box family protein [Ichthyophthirius multifiliis]EGR28256.1 PAS domain S-box family protein [Ichthyophthirius multifiliis]|eukprot:XP_004027601.1 PAS domain S-box family protein [Ichthyophthirius multifiliis]